MSTAFYFSLACETCGEDMYEGLIVTLLEHNGYPVLDLDMTTSQVTFTCGNCGGVTYTGDFDDMTFHEAGEEPESDDEEAPDD